MFPIGPYRFGNSAAMGGSTGIPVPPLTGMVFCVSTRGIAPGWQNAQNLIRAFGDTNNGEFASTSSSPYPLDWASAVWEQDVGANPRLGTWLDQSGNAFDATQGTDAQRPDISIVNERFDFTSADSQFLATNPITGLGNILTGYIVARVSAFTAVAPLCHFGFQDSYLTNTDRFAVYTAATTGVLSVTQNTTDTVPVFNSKLRTLVAGTRYLISFVFDRTIAGAGATVLRVNASTTGVTNGSTSNMNSNNFSERGLGIGTGMPLGATVYLDGSVEHLSLFAAAHSGSELAAWENYLNFCLEVY